MALYYCIECHTSNEQKIHITATLTQQELEWNLELDCLYIQGKAATSTNSNKRKKMVLKIWLIMAC